MDQLGLFKPATFPQALMGSEYITLRPYLGLPERGLVEFLLKDNKEYINLEETTLTVKCKITNADGTPIKATSVSAHDDQVALVNNSMHSLFSDVEVQINGKRVEGGDNNIHISLISHRCLDIPRKHKRDSCFR